MSDEHGPPGPDASIGDRAGWHATVAAFLVSCILVIAFPTWVFVLVAIVVLGAGVVWCRVLPEARPQPIGGKTFVVGYRRIMCDLALAYLPAFLVVLAYSGSDGFRGQLDGWLAGTRVARFQDESLSASAQEKFAHGRAVPLSLYAMYTLSCAYLLASSVGLLFYHRHYVRRSRFPERWGVVDGGLPGPALPRLLAVLGPFCALVYALFMLLPVFVLNSSTRAGSVHLLPMVYDSLAASVVLGFVTMTLFVGVAQATVFIALLRTLAARYRSGGRDV